MAQKTVKEIIEAQAAAWMAVEGVVGVAEGETDGKPAVVILSTRPESALRQAIPDSVEGYPVLVQVTNPIEARERD